VSDRKARDELFARMDDPGNQPAVKMEFLWLLRRLLEAAEAERDALQQALLGPGKFYTDRDFVYELATAFTQRDFALDRAARALRVVEAARDVPLGLRGPLLCEALDAFDAGRGKITRN
jgi:hypothetical protein